MKLKLKFNQAQWGFTLMEIVLVLFIFTLASLLIAEIFVNVQHAQKRTRDLQIVLTEARYLLDVLAREIRGKEINYTAYTSEQVAVPETELNVIDGDGYKIFRKAEQADCDTDEYDYEAPCVQLSTGSGWYNITTTRLAIDKLDFYINPQTNPYPDEVTAATPNIQPHVTIVLKVHSTRLKPTEQVPFYLQTTVTARYYKR